MRRRMLVLFIVERVGARADGRAAGCDEALAASRPGAAPAQKPDAAPAAPAAPRPMELADIIAWKNIGATAFSNDGRWIAYRMSPIEGDSEVFVKATDSDKVYRFPVGEAPSMGGGPGGPGEGGPPPATLRFSDDSKWVAFMVYPTRAEGQRLRRQRRPVQAKMQLLDVDNGQGRDDGERPALRVCRRARRVDRVPEGTRGQRRRRRGLGPARGLQAAPPAAARPPRATGRRARTSSCAI